jgi:LPXTG-motif cell wall-anchored protein
MCIRDRSGNPIQSSFPGLNYFDEGLAIYNGTSYNDVNYAGLCKSISTKQFVESETTSGRTADEVVEELNDMDASEDKSTLEQLGGNSFTTLSIQQISLTGAVTKQPTAVEGTTATLNGEYLIGSKTATSTRFIFGIDASCSTGTTVFATPTSAATGTPVSFDATELTEGTTYYYKVVGTVDAGTDDEADVEGDCAQFVVAQGLPSGDPTVDDPAVDEPTVGGSPIVTNLPATGASSRLQVLATLMTMIGLALVVVRRRRVI